MDAPSTTFVHGPGGVISAPGQTAPTSDKKKKKKAINAMITPKEFGAKFKLTEKDAFYAASETWNVGAAISALSALNTVARDEAYSQEVDDVAQLARIMRDLLDFIGGQVDEMDDAMTANDSADMIMYKEAKSQFLSTKELDGAYRWTMITSSAFEDRDGEIISEKALENDCDQMELTGEYGELLWYHSDGTQHAQDKEARPYLPLGSCDTSFVYEKLNIESGLYYDNAVGKVFSEKASEFGASKSFWHKEDEPVDGVYTYIRTKERSILPRTKEANLLTRLFGHKEKEMADNKDRIAALTEKLGKEKTDELLAQGKVMSEKAEKVLKSKEAAEEVKEEEKKPEAVNEEIQAALTAQKESNDKLVLAMKEAKEATDKFAADMVAFKEAQAKEVVSLKEDMSQVQGALATLLGFQPKGANKFVASQQGKEKELTAEQEKAAQGQLTGVAGLAQWILDGSNTPTA